MNNWISVKDELPELHVKVLALLNDEPIVLELDREYPSYKETFEEFDYWSDPSCEILEIDLHEVTHWMPLPKPPKEGK